jgi:hypothetical protein
MILCRSLLFVPLAPVLSNPTDSLSSLIPFPPYLTPSFPRHLSTFFPFLSHYQDIEQSTTHATLENPDLLVENPNHRSNMWGKPGRAGEEGGDDLATVGDLPGGDDEGEEDEEEGESSEEEFDKFGNSISKEGKGKGLVEEDDEEEDESGSGEEEEDSEAGSHVEVDKFGNTVRRLREASEEEVDSGDERDQVERELVGGLEELSVQGKSRS